MNNQLFDKLLKLRGLKCCDAKLALSSGLKISFGDKVFSHRSKLTGKDIFRGEWELISKYISWRVVQGNRIACSDCDGEELSDPIITSLVGRQLIEVVQNSQFDLSLVFDNEIELDFFGNSDTEFALISNLAQLSHLIKMVI